MKHFIKIGGTMLVVMSLLASLGLTTSAAASDPSCSATNFVDVPDGTYFAEAVRWAACEGITNGTSATTFSPDAPVNRAQMATFLWRYAGRPDAAPHTYSDVPAGSYYDAPAGWVGDQGIASGTSTTTFNPNGSVTRGQMATFLWRFANRPAPLTNSTFTDVPAGAYYATPVAWMHETGITHGTSDSTFSPSRSLTRAEAVTFLWRLAHLPAGSNCGTAETDVDGIFLVWCYGDLGFYRRM